jgi:hypothetical protein
VANKGITTPKKLDPAILAEFSLESIVAAAHLSNRIDVDDQTWSNHHNSWVSHSSEIRNHDKYMNIVSSPASITENTGRLIKGLS